MSITNPEVFPHPASQIEGITLFDMIVLAIINADANLTNYEVFDLAKDYLNLRNIAIQNLDNNKSMNQILKEIKINDNK